MIESIALALPKSYVSVPSTEVGDDISVASGLAQLFSKSLVSEDLGLFEQKMLPYLSDPMRGVKGRVRLQAGQEILDLQRVAAIESISVLGLSLEKISGIIVCSCWPTDVLIGDGARLANSLNYEGPVWNLDVNTAGAVCGLDFADALIRSGRYKKILVLTSCSYRKYFAPDDGATLFMSDGAGCFVVGQNQLPKWILGSYTINTADFEILSIETTLNKDGSHSLLAKVPPSAFDLVNNITQKILETCCYGACRDAGINLDDVNFFIFPNPTAWYCEFACEVLRIDKGKSISVVDLYGNVGPVLCVAHLFHAVLERRISRGDKVLIFGFGPSSVASAIIVRWGETQIAPLWQLR